MRKLLILVLLAAGLLLAWCYTCVRPNQSWTTDSQAAQEEFAKSREAAMKLYHADAAQHARRALELDPDFVAAKVWSLDYADRNDRKRILDSLEAVDLDRLSPREALMLAYALAERGRTTESSRDLAAAYVEKHPKDSLGRMYLCRVLEDSKEQEGCYRKLIAIEPNFVLAQNFLGYLAMGQGRFQEAEERFRTYQYIAPGQANPHDSMGELLVLLGRYDEARQELETALALRADFGPSYINLLQAALLQERVDDAQAAVRRAETAGVNQEQLRCMGCEILLRQPSVSEEWETVFQATDACRLSYCASNLPTFLRHRAALATGRREEARRIEEAATTRAVESGGKPVYGSRYWPAVSEHLRGVRLTFEGHGEEAVDAFEKADEALAYNGFRDGSVKLQNRLALARLLRDLEREQQADTLEEAVRRINADFLRPSVRFRTPEPPAP